MPTSRREPASDGRGQEGRGGPEHRAAWPKASRRRVETPSTSSVSRYLLKRHVSIASSLLPLPQSSVRSWPMEQPRGRRRGARDSLVVPDGAVRCKRRKSDSLRHSRHLNAPCDLFCCRDRLRRHGERFLVPRSDAGTPYAPPLPCRCRGKPRRDARRPTTIVLFAPGAGVGGPLGGEGVRSPKAQPLQRKIRSNCSYVRMNILDDIVNIAQFIS